MKVGDLVKFFSDESDYAGQVGLVTRLQKVSKWGGLVWVQWPTMTGTAPSGHVRYPERQLEVINERR